MKPECTEGRLRPGVCDARAVYDRLRTLENGLETGHVTEWPVAIGDTVYSADTGAKPYTVDFIYASKTVQRIHAVSEDGTKINFKPKHIGAHIFLDPVEAHRKWAERNDLLI